MGRLALFGAAKNSMDEQMIDTMAGSIADSQIKQLISQMTDKAKKTPIKKPEPKKPWYMVGMKTPVNNQYGIKDEEFNRICKHALVLRDLK